MGTTTFTTIPLYYQIERVDNYSMTYQPFANGRFMIGFTTFSGLETVYNWGITGVVRCPPTKRDAPPKK